MRSIPEALLVLLVGSLCDMASSESKLITHPLTPHHVQRERFRQRQRGLELPEKEEEETANHSTVSSSSSVRRRTEAQQVGALYLGYGTHYADICQ